MYSIVFVKSYHIPRRQHKSKIPDPQTNESPEHPGWKRFSFPRIEEINSPGQTNPADGIFIGVPGQHPHHQPERAKPGRIICLSIGEVMTYIGDEKQQEKYGSPQVVAGTGYPEQGPSEVYIERPYTEKG